MPKQRIIFYIALVLSIMALGWAAGAASGQAVDGCPDGPDCIDAADFDTDLDGWSPYQSGASWMNDKTLGLGNLAYGLLYIHDQHYELGEGLLSGASKTFYLQVGAYKVVLRAGQDATFLANRHQVRITYPDVSQTQTIFEHRFSAWSYGTFETGTFWITRPGSVRIDVGSDVPIASYYDFIYLEQQPSTSPTSTPTATFFHATNTPGGPTETATIPPTATTTPVPLAQQATSIPAGTSVCRNVTPTPTGGVPVYGTTEPTPAFSISRLEQFEHYHIYNEGWKRLGQVSEGSDDHSGNGSYSAAISYDLHGAITTTATFSNALTFSPLGFGYPIWLNAWAKADVVPVGQTAQAEVWQEIDGTWYLASSTNISAGRWYPIHAVLDAAADAIAFVATRSDSPSFGYALIDDVYLYAPESAAPFCSGEYPAGALGIRGIPNSSYVYSPHMLNYPGDKPCPGAVMEPNNLWGMILSQFTFFLDTLMAYAPAHLIGETRALAQQYLISPIGGLVILATVIIDWNIPMLAIKIFVAVEAGIGIVGIWKAIRRTFIV
jgi:hypothetical protein